MRTEIGKYSSRLFITVFFLFLFLCLQGFCLSEVIFAASYLYFHD
jgi:hypothetical protein